MSTVLVRRLRPSDAPSITRLIGAAAYGPRTLARELASGTDYLWMGTVDQDGTLCAVHRAMRWGNHLLLKGIVVREDRRGGGTALELVFGLREEARVAGFAGLVAWAEPHQPESVLARRLRLRIAGPLLHRFEVPAAAATEPEPEDAPPPPDSGSIGFESDSPRTAHPLLPCVLDTDVQPLRQRDQSILHWVADRHRLVVSGYPYASVADLPEFVRAVETVTRARRLRSIEIPLPAADLATALALTRTGARRLSRTPVRVARLDFDVARVPEQPPYDRSGRVSRR
ncbi:hypothetical protein [Nocardia wallacei]|uniref:hypothetical protein n=1 Tax=Nocardia wallacei TaxID=480035 RepID=UPI002458ADC0|nr:hypothetical protein [Nocardia wallacei]